MATRRKLSRKAKAGSVDNHDLSADEAPQKQAKLDDQLKQAVAVKVFKRKAETLAASVQDNFKDTKVSFNPEKPRRGSFEVSLDFGDDKEPVVVWTGLKKGPPRKLKFPEGDVVVQEIKKLLK